MNNLKTKVRVPPKGDVVMEFPLFQSSVKFMLIFAVLTGTCQSPSANVFETILVDKIVFVYFLL